MRLGLFISLSLHMAILAWAAGSISSSKPPETPDVQRIDVEILTVEDLTRLRAGNRKKEAEKTKAKSKPEDKPKPKKVQKAKPEPDKKVARLPPKTVEESQPEPKREKKPKTEPKPEKITSDAVPRKRPRTQPKKREKPKPKKTVERKKTPPTKTKRKSEFDPDRIAALLDKIPDASPDAGQRPEPEDPPETEEIEVRRGQADGTAARLTISQFDFFMRQIGQCWNPPVGAARAQDLVPVIAFNLNRDGTIDGVPRAVNAQNSPFFRAAVEAAVRAVIACQPYNLPKDKYDNWASNEITFDPKAMFGG